MIDYGTEFGGISRAEAAIIRRVGEITAERPGRP
jgi:hypothetical protein